MGSHKQAGERPRTAPDEAALALFREHFERTLAFSDALRDARCRRTDHFGARVAQTVAVFRPLEGAHKAELVFLLSMEGPRRFNALKRALGGVSSRVLTDKLRGLEADGLVERRDGAYALTARGEAVARLLHPLVFFLHNEPLLAPAHPSSSVAATLPST